MRTAFLGVLTSTWISILAPVHAATFLVTNLANAGPGSLRQAVLDANATAGADEVTFQSGLSGTIVLSGSAILSDDDLVVHGPGAGLLSVSGSSQGSFWITSGAEVTLSGLKICCAYASMHYGGGVYVDGGSLTLTDSVVSNNSASHAGGGLFLRGGGSHVIRNTSIVNNLAGILPGDLSGSGGGIYLGGGTLTIENSTLAGNGMLGGVNHFPGAGGGLSAYGSTVRVINSTFSGNGGYGYGSAAYFGNSTAYLVLTTVNENRNAGWPWSQLGGLALEGGAIHLDHSIVANTSGFSPGVDLFRSSGTIDAVYSLIETPNAAINGPSSHNVLGKDPMLAPLLDNGGPTATHALLPGSPAFNRGKPGITDFPAFDQRGPGFPRVVNGTVDIGSFESQDLLSLAEVPLLSPVGLLLLIGGLLAAGLRAVRGWRLAS